MLTTTFRLTLPGSVQLNFEIVAQEASRVDPATQRRIFWWDGAAFLRSAEQLPTKREVHQVFTLDDVAGMEGMAFVREAERRAWSAWVHQTVTAAKAARDERRASAEAAL